jgi:hypothetical protein
MFYRASLIYQGEEFTIIMDANFNFLQLKSRPHRWLNTTLKMRQELIVEEEKMETRIPDIRYYISTNAQVPFDHELFHQINRSKNKILCLSQKSKFGLRIHQDFPLSNAIVSVRQVEVETFVCDELRDVEFVVLNVKEFSSPNTKDPTEGFQLVREKVEAEFRLTPNFTDELGHFASYKFAHFFMNTGLEFVEFLRAHNV